VRERRTILPVLLLGLAGSAALYVALGAPAAVIRAMLAGLLAGAGATLVNFVWKLSLHAAVAAGCAVLLWPASPAAGTAMAAAALLVGASRVVVAHHSPAQVLAGWVYGALAMAGAARLVGG
jgi:membrane-associated phospholipid phosphatase